MLDAADDDCMLVRHFMSTSVRSLLETQSCREALSFLRENSIRRAPVLRDGLLSGMVSERDLLRVLPGTVAQMESDAGADAERLSLARVMVTKVITLEPEEHLEEAARKMLNHKVGGLPVVLYGRVVGILTESDVFRAMTKVLDSRGVLRVSISRAPRAGAPPDPVRMAVNLGLEVCGMVTHDRRGGESLSVLRLRGEQCEALVGELTAAGYAVLEIRDSREGGSAQHSSAA